MKRNVFLTLILAALLPVVACGQKSVVVSEAGTLSSLISEAEKYTIEELTVSGPLNGSDLALLRDMAGCDSHGDLTAGRLRVLDLSGATMVAGGAKYIDSEKITLQEGYDVTNGETGFHFEAAEDVMPEWAFAGCNSLEEISLPAGIREIATMAFFTLDLKKADIPASVNTIGARAFYHNIRLQSVTLPAGLKEIGDRAFGYCTGIQTITALMPKPLAIQERTFQGIYDDCTLNVPKGKESLYEASAPWNSFKSIAGITVKEKLNKTKATLEKGKTVTLKASLYPTGLADKSVTWKSSNKKVAKVSSKGKVKAVKAGTATITCTSKMTGAKATCKVTVINGTVTLSETELFIEKGTKKTLEATVTPTTLEDKSVTWTTSNKKIATVSSTGKVKGVKYGTATITCTCVATGVSATCKVTVGDVVLSKSEVSVKKGKTAKLTATVYPTTLEDQSVTWTTSNKKIATVSSSGKVKGIKAGTVTITCTSVATGLSATCTVTVVSASTTRSLEGNDDDETTGIEHLEAEPATEGPFDVYDLSGRKVLSHVTSLDGLPNGVYIVNGKKMLKK